MSVAVPTVASTPALLPRRGDATEKHGETPPPSQPAATDRQRAHARHRRRRGATKRVPQRAAEAPAPCVPEMPVWDA